MAQESRKAAGDCDVWTPPPQSFLLVIHPPPSPVVLFPLLSPVPDCGGGGGCGRGFRVAGSFMAFQNPRLSLAHLSFSFTVFSALGSGCISRKFSPGAGGGPWPGLEVVPARWNRFPPQALPLLRPCGGTHHLGFQLCRSGGN